MAASLLQKARQRKIIYFGVIAVLFTVSLIHREFILKPQAYALQLRETTRGDVELTSSAVRLMLTGSRGLAVTMLWYTAMDKQKRNEWNELELIVESITKLQPHFITPWLYQSWNISFNVAVESDRPRDKYYYISRGLQLLAKGERFNRGTGDETGVRDPKKIVFPGNPEMRYYMGFTYQLKIGNSDERLTMRTLLELSCIDPLERNPDKFWTTDEYGRKKVNLEQFARFTQKYPRVVRRLREQLGYAEPENVVKFLQDHQDIPNRFEPTAKGARESKVKKDPLEQFPILPPHEEKNWPDPSEYHLTNESIGVFLVSRAWYEFAQKPLPPPNPTPGLTEPSYDKMRYRIPKGMVTQLFRNYPPRAQVYIAETLESEGFFDSDGWNVPDWFSSLTDRPDGEFSSEEGFVVGTEAKYHSQAAWEKSYRMYKDYGIENGIYLSLALEKELDERAQFARRELKLTPGDMPTVRSEWREGELGKSLEAHLRLRSSAYYRRLSNFDAFFYQAEGERDPLTVSARKSLFLAGRRAAREDANESLLALYEQGWQLYVQAALAHPKFAQVTSMQEELYEVYQRYLGFAQGEESRKKQLKNSSLWLAFQPVSPLATGLEEYAYYWLVGSNSNKSLVKFRQRRGALDNITYYDAPGADPLREQLLMWSRGALVAMQPAFTSTITYPGEAHLYLTRFAPREEPVPAGWQRLITDETHRVVDMRLGLNK